ncbi:MAG: YbaB/EbfC family nucleoid-associated protein [Desulfobulbaceae bacterium]|nr:YbaB/EbfC family nucleoid-associated protein [Desulfobulbaceae bacterium]
MDMQAIMQQAQQFQQKMGQMQEELALKTVSSTVGGGMVSATVNGKFEVVSLQIEKEAVDPDDPVMLQDLVMAAINDAMKKAREMSQAEMAKLTGGMGLNIPGLF